MDDDAVTEPEAGDRTGWIWVLLFAATLGVPAVVVALDGAVPVADRLLGVGLAALLVLWFFATVGLSTDRWQAPLRRLAFWAVAVPAVVVLVGVHPLFLFCVYGLYPLLFGTLGWWAVGPVVGFTALVGWRTEAWGAGRASVLNLAAVTALAVGIAVVIEAVDRQSRRRRDALAALTATRAELAETARRAGMLEERERLARDLHDTVAQSLASVVTHLEAAEQALEDRPPDARRHLGVARDAARDGLTEARSAVAALRPDLLAGQPLSAALECRADRWSAATGIVAAVRSNGQAVPLHPEAETALLRAAGEALANVAKHARATRVTLTLSWLGDVVTLDVDDDGVGFADVPAPRGDSGFGLPGLRERLAAVGGRLEVESAPGEGTTVMAQVPS